MTDEDDLLGGERVTLQFTVDDYYVEVIEKATAKAGLSVDRFVEMTLMWWIGTSNYPRLERAAQKGGQDPGIYMETAIDQRVRRDLGE